MSGSKNRGQVRNNETIRGYYDPNNASVNYIVPDVKTLFCDTDPSLKVIPPTHKIERSFELIDRRKEHVLAYDLKKLGRGYKGKELGDEDMWGTEQKPNLEERLEKLEIEHAQVDDAINAYDNKRYDIFDYECELVLLYLSERIRSVRGVEYSHRTRLNTLNKQPSSSDYSKSYARSQI